MLLHIILVCWVGILSSNKWPFAKTFRGLSTMNALILYLITYHQVKSAIKTFLYTAFYPYSPHTLNIMDIFESWSVLAVTYSPAHCQLTGICTYTHTYSMTLLALALLEVVRGTTLCLPVLQMAACLTIDNSHSAAGNPWDKLLTLGERASSPVSWECII